MPEHAENAGHKQTEMSLQELTQDLESTRQELAECTARLIQAGKQNVLKELISAVAHELNQPLNVTKIICQGILRDILKNRFSEEEAKNDLPEIVRQMDKLSHIIARMCVFARRNEKIAFEAHDLNLLVRDALTLISQQYKDHNIKLVENLAPNLPFVMADLVGIEQVCLNLLNNARDAVENSKKPEMKIEIKTFLGPGGKTIVLEVLDNGAGIPDEVKPRIFQPLFTTKINGAGLGLSVCQKIVEEHHGKIEFESRAGEGTAFRVTLPGKE